MARSTLQVEKREMGNDISAKKSLQFEIKIIAGITQTTWKKFNGVKCNVINQNSLIFPYQMWIVLYDGIDV